MDKPLGPVNKLVAMKIRASILKYSEKLEDKKMILAVSGGPDSLAMLLAAQNVGLNIKKKFIVANFSHGLRPKEDESERILVKNIAENFGFSFTSGSDEVLANEASAREARYNFLGKVALENDASAILTAHTRNDQAETVLLRLIRGTGLKGIRSIREISSRKIYGNEIYLLRPMLEVTRDQTEAICNEFNIQPARDKSNESLHYSRNRVRLKVIPELIKVNSQAQSALAAFAERAASDNQLLEDLALEAVAGFESRHKFSIEWDKKQLRQIPEPLLVRILENSWRQLTEDGSTLGSKKLQQMTRVIHSSGEVYLGKAGKLQTTETNKVIMKITKP